MNLQADPRFRRIDSNDLEAAYEQMAREEAREAEAIEWAEATLGDIVEEMR